MGGSLVFGSPTWLFMAAALFVLGTGLIAWRYSRSSLTPSTRLLCGALKTVALLLLCLCLLEPLWTGQRARQGANLFAIVADNSQSLSIKDQGSTVSRGEKLKQLLTDEKSPWQVRLAQDFDLRKYIFDSRLQNVTDFSRLEFNGTQSSLIGVLNNLKDRFRNRPLAGVLLLTDGVATDLKHAEFNSQGLPAIYPVVMGAESQTNTIPDLSVSHLVVTTTAFEDAPVTIQADVVQSGLPKSKVTAQVVDETGAIVKQETQSFSSDNSPLPFRFQIRPKHPGLSFYEVRVRTNDEARRAESAQPTPGAKLDKIFNAGIQDPYSVESTLANNRRLVAVDRGSTQYRVLYLCGRPNWEFKFLRRAIESDDQVQLTAVIRIAKKEPKFDWRGRAGEVSNPLFRGFEGKTEDTERYDQPVLVRLNTKSPDELREGFPKTIEELYQFHAVIIDDLESEFFSPDQLSLIERFVSERGGGLMMLGGAETFRQGKYEKTPLSRILPIYLEPPTTAPSPNGYRLALTKEGWLNPWARLRSTETEEQVRIGAMPSFLTLNRTGQVKPGATVIDEATDLAGHKYPGLAVQPFGRGRAAAMLIGDLWRWQLDRSDEQREKEDLGKAWRQAIRWLIADVPDRIELRSVAKDDLGQPLMRIEARVRTKEFQPQDNAAVTVNLQLPDGTTVSQVAEPSLQDAGLYESTFAARQSGCYRVKVDVVDGEGQSVGHAETGWAADPAADEFARVIPNGEFLSQIAKQTSGEVVPFDELDSFVRSLPTRKAPLTEAYSVPLWHQTWMLLLIVICLCGEWALRRWRGLP